MPKPDLNLKQALRAASRAGETERLEEAAAQIALVHDRSSLTPLPIARIRPRPDQPRRHFDEEALEELAASIREQGLLQPIVVRRLPNGDYELVAGERRWRAAQRAGQETIPAIVRTLEADQALEASLTENLQRENLTPLEESRIFHRMTEELGYSIRQLAQRIGKGKGYVEDRLRLARMEPALQQLVAERPDALTHAREIEKVEDPALRQALIREAQAGEPLQQIRQRIRQSIHVEERRVSGRPDTPEDPGEHPASAAVASMEGTAVRQSADPVRASEAELSSQFEALEAIARRLRIHLEVTDVPANPARRQALLEELTRVLESVQGFIARLKRWGA